jgi:phage protein D
MPSGYQVFLDGEAADDAFYTSLTSLEVEESMDFPGALQLNVPVNRSESGDLTAVAESRFRPMANIAVVASVDSSAAGGAAAAIGSAIGIGGGNGSQSGTQCIFDGFVLSHKLHLERGITNSTLSVWGQDASYLMNLEEKVKEWVDVTDADVANSIFGDYGISPADENTDDDSPSHTESGHSLMQRGSDIQFLRMLARRNGKICRVACKDKPGQRTGYFSKPALDGDVDFTLALNDPDAWTVESLDLNWDVGRPTSVSARQALFDDDDEDGVSADSTDSGLNLLGERDLASFAQKPMKVLLAAPVDDGGELSLRAQAVLREAAWFVNCEGESDAGRLGGILRAGMLVEITGIGGLHSGKYLVWSVRHTITAEAHMMKFVLKRNAVGAADSAGAGLSGLLGGL